jgi:ribosomal protein S18 acetylase RimI-like enzyme
MPDIPQWEKISTAIWPTLDSFEHDGWIIRTSEGYTKRSNSVNPIHSGEGNIDEKIAYCEQHFRTRNLPVIFKMTYSARPPNLDETLSMIGYRKDSPTSFMTINLLKHVPSTSCSVRIEPAVNKDWLYAYDQYNDIGRKNKKTFHRMLKDHHPPMGFLLLTHGNRTVGCGLSILAGTTAGLFDIAVDENERGKGFGQEITQSLMAWAKVKGANTGFLQVECENMPAIRLYEKLGFKEEYIYWYRIKE